MAVCVMDPLVCAWFTAALELKEDYLKAYMRRAQAREALEKYEDALEGTYTYTRKQMQWKSFL